MRLVLFLFLVYQTMILGVIATTPKEDALVNQVVSKINHGKPVSYDDYKRAYEITVRSTWDKKSFSISETLEKSPYYQQLCREYFEPLITTGENLTSQLDRQQLSEDELKTIRANIQRLTLNWWTMPPHENLKNKYTRTTSALIKKYLAYPRVVAKGNEYGKRATVLRDQLTPDNYETIYQSAITLLADYKQWIPAWEINLGILLNLKIFPQSIPGFEAFLDLQHALEQHAIINRLAKKGDLTRVEKQTALKQPLFQPGSQQLIPPTEQSQEPVSWQEIQTAGLWVFITPTHIIATNNYETFEAIYKDHRTSDPASTYVPTFSPLSATNLKRYKPGETFLAGPSHAPKDAPVISQQEAIQRLKPQYTGKSILRCAIFTLGMSMVRGNFEDLVLQSPLGGMMVQVTGHGIRDDGTGRTKSVIPYLKQLLGL